ncbi:hypothetical protein TRIUR3_28386 [Triticum urartu]|uniref:glucomannan 4-beta-mannosyltransferase n=2 Tax=Triticum TaxID=4564 RepID=M7ZU14_TRIUA|nr:hypothetical protein TRIUR3_28386 [Triticum urartu]
MHEPIRQHLLRAHQCQKTQVDKQRAERSFAIGDKVFVKMQPYVQSFVVHRVNHKLAFKFHGLYLTIATIGDIAYRLELPDSSKIHPDFHVLQLEKYILLVTQVQTSLPHVDDEFQIPLKFLRRRVHHVGSKTIPRVLVEWSCSPSADVRRGFIEGNISLFYGLETSHFSRTMGWAGMSSFSKKRLWFSARTMSVCLSIGAVCGLSWPSDRLVVQVLDDSTDPLVKEMVRMECERWAHKGINITYQIREDRKGYKAGALKAGMKHGYVRECEYMVIFDADFQPDPDFLHRTIPYLHHNPEIALVQARWRFVNADECLMTRMQEMSLDYHFKVEQEVSSSVCAFFGFNGTAGVWRIAAVNEAGGWKDRTTVEDMDLAIRASLKGWKFVYLGDVQVKSELPSTFKAFRFQQHRWSCGPANLFRKMLVEIVTNKKVTIWKKFHVIYNFFLVRKIVAHIVTFTFYCIIIPTTIFVPEVHIPKWGCVYIPTIITLLNSVGTPRSFHLLFFWILFENVMSLHRTKATLIGLLEAGRANEWVVTEKLGSAMKMKSANKASARKSFMRMWESEYVPVVMGSRMSASKSNVILIV